MVAVLTAVRNVSVFFFWVSEFTSVVEVSIVSSVVEFLSVFIHFCKLVEKIVSESPETSLPPIIVTNSSLNADQNGNGGGATVVRADSSDPLIGWPVVGPTCTTAACPLTVCLFLHNNITRRFSRKLFICILYNTGLTQELEVSNAVTVL